jgi:hypothetical protein
MPTTAVLLEHRVAVVAALALPQTAVWRIVCNTIDGEYTAARLTCMIRRIIHPA